MAADFIAGISVFKSLYDSAKALKDINDATIRNAAVMDIQEKVLTAQAAQSDLIEKIRHLEEEVRNFKTWETEKQRYELKRLGTSVLAYMLKPSVRGSEPPHWVCTNCYAKGYISIIQNSWVAGSGQRFRCPMCKTQMNPPSEAFENGSIKWLD